MGEGSRRHIRPTDWYGGYEVHGYQFRIGINAQLNQAQFQMVKPMPECGRIILRNLGWKWHDKDKVWYIPINPGKRRRELIVNANTASFELSVAFRRRQARLEGRPDPYPPSDKDCMITHVPICEIVYPGSEASKTEPWPELWRLGEEVDNVELSGDPLKAALEDLNGPAGDDVARTRHYINPWESIDGSVHLGKDAWDDRSRSRDSNAETFSGPSPLSPDELPQGLGEHSARNEEVSRATREYELSPDDVQARPVNDLMKAWHRLRRYWKSETKEDRRASTMPQEIRNDVDRIIDFLNEDS